LLIVLVIISIYASGLLWLDLSWDFSLELEEEIKEPQQVLSIWDKIRPSKSSITTDYQYMIYDGALNQQIWTVFVEASRDAFRYIYEEEDVVASPHLGNNLKIHFSNPMPMDLIIEGMGIGNTRISDFVSRVEWIAYETETQHMFVSDGRNVYRLDVSIEGHKLDELTAQATQYAQEHYDAVFNMSESGAFIPISSSEKAWNPIFIKSEIDVEDQEAVQRIAKDYFKDSFDYVRTTIDRERTINYVYRNEKVLRLYEEGFLEFYDAMEIALDEGSSFEAFSLAIQFIEDFLGFPEDGYLSRVTPMMREGKYGYRFEFSYHLFDRPIIFSQVREEKAIQIEVIGNRVVYYQRFIRDIDYDTGIETEEVEVLNPRQIVEQNIDFITELYLEDDANGHYSFDEAKSKILESIYEIHLAYFDPSRRSRDQLIRSVWVVKTDDRSYIFNAITGTIIEEQHHEREGQNGLE